MCDLAQCTCIQFSICYKCSHVKNTGMAFKKNHSKINEGNEIYNSSSNKKNHAKFQYFSISFLFFSYQHCVRGVIQLKSISGGFFNFRYLQSYFKICLFWTYFIDIIKRIRNKFLQLTGPSTWSNTVYHAKQIII